MGKYVIDGLFLTQRITGTQRYAYELLCELDKISKKDEFQIVVPDSASELPVLKNIEIVKYGKRNGIIWQQTDLAHYLRKNNKNVRKKCVNSKKRLFRIRNK